MALLHCPPPRRCERQWQGIGTTSSQGQTGASAPSWTLHPRNSPLAALGRPVKPSTGILMHLLRNVADGSAWLYIGAHYRTRTL
ncbi:hypothetical protein DOTSEDRAFT_75803 [Dothistroma septosporum NZE10]|uniref:Uncharacterized protein n=1 Tax=Dothistroma septosporum (strain NZE10 / CBS 128990) TaxID=675120 RepID=N1PC66_DOTSN|nr:hypothetical protein DOTSEDRAFT_75803 [Dothistroma septosporum NZE10]